MFADRQQAGQKLCEKISPQLSAELVLGLARGGVAVSAELAKALHIPHDVLIVKKISSPHEPELAIGALAPDGISYVDYRMAQMTGADEMYIQSQIRSLDQEIREKSLMYRKGKAPLVVRGKTIIITDDGAATGATITAAASWARKKHAKKIIIALPVAPPDVANRLKSMADEVIVLDTPQGFGSVGEFYTSFPQLTDEEVVKLLSV